MVELKTYVNKQDFVDAVDSSEARIYDVFEDPIYVGDAAKNGEYQSEFLVDGLNFERVLIDEGYLKTIHGDKIVGIALVSGKPNTALYGFYSKFYRAFSKNDELIAVETSDYAQIVELLGLKLAV